ncbi:MAG: UDP-N-acetylglucosamine 2-epimerase [Flavobacteriaceae bacterium]|nr:UDP-N-acetylglucosamine 2-epimerase [Flavobacteriaceae bacterium]
MSKNRKKIVFLTGTRADFGKLKSLIKITQEHPDFEAHIFATGMHLEEKYGETHIEIEKSGFKNIYRFKNHEGSEFMDRALAKTIQGFSEYVANLRPDLIVVHGDRVEPLAGAIVGSLNNILVAHVEGGEVSGTIDELIRHAVSKMSHIHLVSNKEAKKRLIQMGELASSIFVIGSPDLDLMNPAKLPSLDVVKSYYKIPFDNFAIVMYHPVTTQLDKAQEHAAIFVKALLKSAKNYVVIYPNNDMGSQTIFDAYEQLNDKTNIKIFPSLRFEYFLRLLKEADFIIGNSSAGIREAPYYGTPAIDVGTRQQNRVKHQHIKHVGFDVGSIYNAIKGVKKEAQPESFSNFGKGDSAEQFLDLLLSDKVWQTDCQKQFQDL